MATTAAGSGAGGATDSFGTAGHVRTNFGGAEHVSALVVQPDGRIVAAGGSDGDFALARYLPGGRLDASFGRGGKVRTDVGRAASVSAVAIHPDGKIVAGAGSDGGLTLTRFLPNGRLDRRFGSHGKLLTAVRSSH
jgi:uncharacterized delta-60 repeat protein